MWAEWSWIKALPAIGAKALPYYLSILAGAALVSLASARALRLGWKDAITRFGAAYAPMGVLFSLGQAVGSILGRGGNIANAFASLFGGGWHYPAAWVEKATLAGWTGFANTWLIGIAAAWSLVLVWGVARRLAGEAESGTRKALAAFLPHLLALVPLNYAIIQVMAAMKH